MRRIGLTGGIATGKSHVRARFENLGIPTIDSDVLAREALAPRSAGLAAVAERFGRTVLKDDGSLDRDGLAKIVFADPEARKDLEAIVHPYVQRRTDEWFAGLDTSRYRYAIADIPLLYEVGRDKDFDEVIVVACTPETQLKRLLERGMTEAGGAPAPGSATAARGEDRSGRPRHSHGWQLRRHRAPGPGAPYAPECVP